MYVVNKVLNPPFCIVMGLPLLSMVTVVTHITHAYNGLQCSPPEPRPGHYLATSCPASGAHLSVTWPGPRPGQDGGYL